MACAGDIFSRAIIDEMMNCAYQSSSTETTWHWDSLSVYISPDDRNVPKRLKRTAVRQPDVSRYSMVIVNAPTFRGNKFQVGGSKK